MSSFDLSHEEVESLINEISLGGKIVSIKNIAGKIKTLFISHCSLEEKLYATAIYDLSYSKAIEDGFLTVKETEENLRVRGIFTEEDEEKADKIRSKIEGQEKLLEKMVRVPARRDRVKNNISTLKDELFEILSKKESLLEYSAERKAHEDRLLFLCWRGAKVPITKELFWRTQKDFNGEKDLVLRRNVFNEHIKLAVGIDPTTLRFVARHNLWRIRYNSAIKTGVSLFGVELPDYSVDQLSLSSWSSYYQSINDMLPDEKPSDDIIEDDEALDAFMKSYMDEQNREAAVSKGKKKGKQGTKSAWDHGDVIVTGSDPLYKDVKYSPTVEAIKNKGKKTISVEDKGRKIK